MKSTRQALSHTRPDPAPSDVSRRDLFAGLAAIVVSTLAWRTDALAQAGVPMAVYKDPSCGCCEAWVAHMKANGFSPTVTNTADTNAIKRKHGIAEPLWSCHTAVLGAYVVEGHVPAADVKKLLAQRPKGVVGLTIPGMPASAPGMDTKPFQPYKVLAFDAQGRTTVFADHAKA